jgi:hypothetical protein
VRRLSTPPAAVLAATVIVLTGAFAIVALGVTDQRPSIASVDNAVDAAVTPAPPAVHASRTRTATPVAPLKHLLTPDLLITAVRPLTPSQLVALRRLRGVTGFSVLSTGSLHLGRATLRTVGVDPSSFRAFTPRETASSNALWQAVSRGDLAPSYAAKLPLGRTVHVVGRVRSTARIGAIAAYGLPGADLVVSEALGKQFGLRRDTMLLAAPDRRLSSLSREVRMVLGDAVDLQVLRPASITYRRPATYRQLYGLSAQYCPGLSWKVLAAIGQVESGHGRNVGPSSAGALGPMQFLPSTWAYAGVDGDGDGRADIWSAYDAVPAAALYLCRNGAGRGGQDLYNAIFSYNHADWYVRKVLALAEQYK